MHTMGVAPIKILGKVCTDGKIAANLGGIRGGHILNMNIMMVVGILFLMYIAYMIFSSDNVEVSLYARTSGKKIAMGVFQERRITSFQNVISIEIAFVFLFLSFTFTKYRT